MDLHNKCERSVFILLPGKSHEQSDSVDSQEDPYAIEPSKYKGIIGNNKVNDVYNELCPTMDVDPQKAIEERLSLRNSNKSMGKFPCWHKLAS